MYIELVSVLDHPVIRTLQVELKPPSGKALRAKLRETVAVLDSEVVEFYSAFARAS